MSDNNENLTSRIGCYLRNLWLALLGNNPYQMELEEAKVYLEKAAENLSTTQDMCYDTMERWNESQKEIDNLQKLVETLRDHLREKDELMEQLARECRNQMEQMKRDYEKRQTRDKNT